MDNNSNIGEMIKGIAIFVAVAGILGAIIIAASDFAEMYEIGAFSFFFFAFISVVSACLLYGFGTLICYVKEIRAQVMKVETKASNNNTVQRKTDNTVVVEHGTQSSTKVVTHKANENADKEMFNDLPKL